MARRVPNIPTGPRRPINRTRILIYLAIIGVAVVLGLNYFSNRLGNYSFIPKDVQIKYVPSEFTPQLNADDALEILRNPYRYSREFNELIYNFNLQLIDHVANRMALPDTVRTKIRAEYEKQHPYLQRLYFNDFVALQDTSSRFYQEWYNSASADAVTMLNEVASKYTCFLINQLLATALETTDGKISVAGRNVDTPCGVALTEALQPMIKRLEDRAAIQDFSRSKGFLEQKIERVTAQLATMEVRDKKGLNKQMQTKLWGFNVSSSELEVTAVSVLKVGFDLHKYFEINIDGNRKTVVVALPEPEILSHEVYPRIDKLDIGWMREVEDADFNKNFNLLRKEFRREALESDIMDKAKTQAQELMQTMLGPLISKIGRDYKLQVAFHNTNPGILDDFEEGTLGS